MTNKHIFPLHIPVDLWKRIRACSMERPFPHGTSATQFMLDAAREKVEKMEAGATWWTPESNVDDIPLVVNKSLLEQLPPGLKTTDPQIPRLRARYLAMVEADRTEREAIASERREAEYKARLAKEQAAERASAMEQAVHAKDGEPDWL